MAFEAAALSVISMVFLLVACWEYSSDSMRDCLWEVEVVDTTELNEEFGKVERTVS